MGKKRNKGTEVAKKKELMIMRCQGTSAIKDRSDDSKMGVDS